MVSADVAPLYGDLNFDNAISSSDALIDLQITVGIIDPSEEMQMLGDVDGDGKISSNDALLILQRTVGIIDLFPVEEK